MGGTAAAGFFRPAGDGDVVTGSGCSNDWQATMFEAADAPRRCFLACAAGVALLAAGCTMCPDPFDYSGPVPNGSAPQNDFAARSNGILPTGANPRPFPPVVKAAPQPTPAQPVGEEAAEAEPKMAADDDGLLRLSAEEPVDEAAASEAGNESAAGEPVAERSGAAVADQPPAVDVAAAAVGAVPPVEPQPEADAWRERSGARDPVGDSPAEPAPRETPGWRARR